MSDIVLRSDWFNSLFPTIIRVFGITVFASLILYLVSMLLNVFGVQLSLWLFIPVWVMAGLILFGLLIDDVIIILCTKYVFEHGHLRYHWKFLREVSHSVQYGQITDVEVRRDIWDRICKTGTIIIHTGSDNDEKSIMRIHSVRHPDLVHDHIQHVIKHE